MNQIKQVHAFSLRNGLDHTHILITKLLEIPNIPYARQLFDLIPQPTPSLYNKLFQAYTCHGHSCQCFSLYAQMLQQCCLPNALTFTFLFVACSSLSSPRLSKIIHAQFAKSGFNFDVFALTAMVDMYAKLGLIDSARKQFDRIQFKDTPTWNSMIAGYARCGNMEEANALFLMMPSKNVISWTTMIAGYSQNGQYVNALNMFLSMEKEGVKPNEVTLASVLPACANLGASEVGERIGKYARQNGYMNNLFVCNALLEMYAKCGKLDLALQTFNQIGSGRNHCSWNTMIMGLAIHGKCGQALSLFHQMLQKEGTVPDDVTLVAALVACTHGGMVAEGQELFESMERKFNIVPKLEHYGCMVDLLGRAGKLNEAYNLIRNMPMKSDSVIWGTLLGACSFHGNVGVAEKAAESLFELEPWNPGNYVILSNIYASAKRWDGVAKLRKMMKSKQIMKVAGYSCIEEAGQVKKFIIEDKSHPRSDEIYVVLHDLYMKMMNVKDETIMDSEISAVTYIYL